MRASDFQIQKASRFSGQLDRIEESRLFIGASIAPVAVSLIRLFGILLLCRFACEILVYGGLISFAPRTLLWLLFFAFLAAFTILISLAFAFTFTLLFECSTFGLLSKRNFRLMFGVLSGFLPTVVWFHYLPVLIGAFPNAMISVVIVLAAVLVTRQASLAELPIAQRVQSDRWQLSVRHMFALTAWAATACIAALSMTPIVSIEAFLAITGIYSLLQIAFFAMDARCLGANAG